jgi:hypothetical protein
VLGRQGRISQKGMVPHALVSAISIPIALGPFNSTRAKEDKKLERIVFTLRRSKDIYAAENVAILD